MTYNAEKQRAYRQARKAKQEAAAAAAVAGSPGAAAEEYKVPGDDYEDYSSNLNIQVEAPDLAPKPAASLKDRLLNFVKPDGQEKTTPARSRGRAKKSDGNMSQVLCATLTGLLVTYSQHLIPEPYKPCAPSPEEASAILSPLFNIMSRMVEVTGKVSQTTLDLTSALLAGLVYGMRAHITYLAIKENEHASKKSSSASSASSASSEYRTGNYSNAPLGIIRDSAISHAAPENADAAENDVIGGRSDNPDSDTERRDIEAAKVRELLGRDRQGRVRLGLLAT